MQITQFVPSTRCTQIAVTSEQSGWPRCLRVVPASFQRFSLHPVHVDANGNSRPRRRSSFRFFGNVWFVLWSAWVHYKDMLVDKGLIREIEETCEA